MRRAETGTARHASWLATFIAGGRAAQDFVRTHARRVDELIDGEVISVTPDAPLDEIVGIMESRRVKRVPVIENGRVVGIVARADLVSALLKALPGSGQAPAVTDAQIRARFLQEVDGQQWAPRGAIDCGVTDGVIELHGVITDERLRPALRVIAENTHGSRGVRDHMACIEPLSGALISEGSDSVLPAA